jgi:(E)-4-hydroxy-3-methylbut-2-enyl-diphosphate synthase
MTNTDTRDVERTHAQITALVDSGCEIVRCAVPDRQAAAAFRKLRERVTVPLVADIHFSAELAVAAIEAGADKVRINPGNIGAQDKLTRVLDAARQAHIPIRVGINAGSLEKSVLDKYKAPCAEALVESALATVAKIESLGFESMVVSIKSSDIRTTVRACTLFAQQSDYPQHIGITESGTRRSGTIRSSAGLGALLLQGVGDTMRVSLCTDPVEEVLVARELLIGLGLRTGPRVIACPTCGRTRIDVASLAEQVEKRLTGMKKAITVAVMGCVVNGPGEAREADIGIAGGKRKGTIFMKGEPVVTVPEEELVERLFAYIGDM